MASGLANQAKKWLPILTMAYFAVFGWVGIVGLARWYVDAIHPMPWDVLPAGFWTYASTTIVMWALPNASLVAAFFVDQKVGRYCLLLATCMILLINFLSWHHDTLYATYIRIGIAMWLALMAYLLMSNNSFKPKPLRGSA